MSLTENERSIIRALVSASLESAEKVWDEHQPVFEAVEAHISLESIAKRAEVAPSRIPNHPFVDSEHSKLSEYVCLVADMRDSSAHLTIAYGKSLKTYQLMKRVYFETAALLPALDQTIQFENGAVTEYLGDGVLALFSVDSDYRGPDIKRAFRAAQNCLGDTRLIVNEELKNRYNLPALDLGVGLGFGDAIVQLVGVPSRMHPKVIGPCVYHATKLSGGRNELFASKPLRMAWPKSDGGKLSFAPVSGRSNVDGYCIKKSG